MIGTNCELSTSVTEQLSNGINGIINSLFITYKGIMGFNPFPSKNFNDYTTNGWYQNSGTNASGTQNAPNSADSGYMLVIKSSENTIHQFWVSGYRGLGIMYRQRYSGTWSAWSTLIS